MPKSHNVLAISDSQAQSPLELDPTTMPTSSHTPLQVAVTQQETTPTPNSTDGTGEVPVAKKKACHQAECVSTGVAVGNDVTEGLRVRRGRLAKR